MNYRNVNLRTCLHFLGAFILVAGLSSAVVIYERANDGPTYVQGYDVEGGSIYPISPEDSKQYLRGLQLYGGTANMLADELRRWFAGLWHGKSLALTIGCVTVLLSSGVFFAANRLLPGSKTDANGDP